MEIWAGVFPLRQIFERFRTETFKILRIDFFYLSDHCADYFAGFARSVAGVAHAPQAVENNAGDGMHHGGEGGYRKNVARDFDGAFFRTALDFIDALGVGHRADVPDIVENVAGIGNEEFREFFIRGPGFCDGLLVEGAGSGVKEKALAGDEGLHFVHADVALGLLFGIVEGMGVQERPDELATNIFEAEFEMGVLKDRVVAAVESGGADVEALFVGDFVRRNQVVRVAGAGSGYGGVVGVGEIVAEGNARRGGFDQLAGSAFEHGRLGGHGFSVRGILHG